MSKFSEHNFKGQKALVRVDFNVPLNDKFEITDDSRMKAASNESFGYNEDEIVSSDIIGIHFGSLFDATQTKVMTVGDKQLVKTVSWYDNEMSYVSQLVRTVHYFAKLIK